MKKIIKISMCVSALLLLSCCHVNTQKSTNQSQKIQTNKIEKYEQDISHFKKISSQELLNNTEKEDQFIYFGKKECKYCRNFVPKLKNVFEQKKMILRYLDIESLSEQERKELFNKYPIQTIPTLIYINKKQDIIPYNEDETRLDVWVNQQSEN